MKVLITGANGQVGWELRRSAPKSYDVLAVDKDQLNITDYLAIEKCIREFQPDVIVNSAAYTAVDRAETEKELAFEINAHAPKFIAKLCCELGIKLIQISTDFVFDGKKDLPYEVEDKPSPINVYGKSKLAGEELVRAYCPDAIIIRTSWVYSVHGNNFVKTMLRLMNEREELSIVSDQVGRPTSAENLAKTIWAVLRYGNGLKGNFHWANDGMVSWYEFALAILDEGCLVNLVHQHPNLNSISSKDYPTAAIRPKNSALAISPELINIANLCHWRDSLVNVLAELKKISSMSV